MSRGLQNHLAKTRAIPNPTVYVTQLLHDYAEWAFDEERCLDYRGRWRAQVFNSSIEVPLDVEIGTGIGIHFADYSLNHPNRHIVGFELKFKPLIQSIRRARRNGSVNARMVRYNATQIEEVFAPDEVNNVFIHFPDPWQKKRSTEKHRLFHGDFLQKLYGLQRFGSFVDFKTDSANYFDFVLGKVESTLYRLDRVSRDLHQSEWAPLNLKTPFEDYFLKENLPIHYLRFSKNH